MSNLPPAPAPSMIEAARSPVRFQVAGKIGDRQTSEEIACCTESVTGIAP